MAGQPDDSRGIEREKQVAAEAAAELVEDGMTVGLGTGSTVAFLLPALARRSLDIVCAATSPRTEYAARELGLRIEDVTSIDRFDLTIDGADQIAPDGWLVKGGGGAHTREKIIAAAADRFVAIAANKGAVARYLSRTCQIPAEQIATIGDQPNDVLMFAHSGLSIAMGNASHEVQQAARRVTTSNEDEGFANAVERFVLS